MAQGPRSFWQRRRRMSLRLTVIGLGALAVLIYCWFDPRLVIAVFGAHPALAALTILVGGVLALLAFVAVMNCLRMLRRTFRRGPHEYDPGWAGPLVHYTEADEDDLGGLGGERDGCF